MSKLSKRAISTTLVIALLLLSIFSVAIPVSAAITGVTVSVAPSPILASETTTITVDVTVDAGDVWTGTITVTDPATGTSTATIGGSDSTFDAKVYPTTFTAGATTAIAGPYLVDVTVDGSTDSISFTVNPSGTLSIDTTPVKGMVTVNTVDWGIAPESRIVAPGDHVVTFGAVAGYVTPSGVTATVVSGETKTVLGTYSQETTPDFTIDTVSAVTVYYDDVLTVLGSGVTAGTEVRLFWDYASGTYVHLLNTTEGNPDATFDCEVTVPSDIGGPHYLWATDIATGETVSYDFSLNLKPKITLSPESGLVKDPVTIKGYGFSKDSVITIAPADIITVPTTVETDELGYFTAKFNVPETFVPGANTISATDGVFPATETFNVGAGLTLTPDEGSSGTIVTIRGRGFTEDVDSKVSSIFIDGTAVLPKTGAVTAILIGADGRFDASIVIPTMPKGKHKIKVVDTSAKWAEVSFEVTGTTVIKISPGYGPPGGSVEVKGYNFTKISGIVVDLTLGGEPLGTAKTDAKGEFIKTVRIPAIDYGPQSFVAIDSYQLTEEKSFRIGIMIVILSPTYGPTGTPVYLTGIGFSEGKTWNATMDGVAITEAAEDIGTYTETISKTIYIPTVPVGTYTVTVMDIDTEIEVIETFEVTGTTEASMDPAAAPNLYNATVTGLNFAGKTDNLLDFVIYNATEDWDMNVLQTIGGVEYSAVTDTDGEFTAWWDVPDDEILSLGSYMINVTDDEGLFAQMPFSIAEERIYITPRKTKFDRGDTVQFDIKNDFYYDDSYMKIYDPVDNLYWVTKTFVENKGEWIKVASLYTVPYYAQTSGGNPMTLSPDAPLGEWFWSFYTDAGKQLVNGTFEVGKSAEALLAEQMSKLSGDVSTLTDDVGDLSGEIADVITDVEGMIDDITTDIAEDLAQVAADTEAAVSDAVSDIEDDIGDIAAAQNELATDIEESKQTSIDAKQAAEAAQEGTQGLTTIVYGAIACSLIAALAAVVSLMQISKKIA